MTEHQVTEHQYPAVRLDWAYHPILLQNRHLALESL